MKHCVMVTGSSNLGIAQKIMNRHKLNGFEYASRVIDCHALKPWLVDCGQNRFATLINNSV